MAQPIHPESMRRARRLKLFEPVDVRIGVAVRRGHMLDVSTSGALLHIGEPPLPGTLLIVTIGGRPRTGRVTWSEANRCGLAFIVPVPASELDALIDAALVG